MTGSRTLYRGTIEYLDVVVTADVDLDAQPVYVSLDNRATWLTAAWIGDIGVTRTARVLLGDDNLLPPSTAPAVFVKVTDDPEVPVVRAGSLTLA